MPPMRPAGKPAGRRTHPKKIERHEEMQLYSGNKPIIMEQSLWAGLHMFTPLNASYFPSVEWESILDKYVISCEKYEK